LKKIRGFDYRELKLKEDMVHKKAEKEAE